MIILITIRHKIVTDFNVRCIYFKCGRNKSHQSSRGWSFSFYRYFQASYCHSRFGRMRWITSGMRSNARASLEMAHALLLMWTLHGGSIYCRYVSGFWTVQSATLLCTNQCVDINSSYCSIECGGLCRKKAFILEVHVRRSRKLSL